MTKESLAAEIISDLTTELSATDPNFFPEILSVKVKNAIKEVRNRRNYEATNYTEDRIIQDLYNNYYGNILNLARYDYNKIGAEGESQHTESSVNRSWVDRETMFNGICPFVKVLNK